MKDIAKFLPGVLLLFLSISGCKTEQPLDPGGDLFGKLFTLNQAIDSSFVKQQGTAEIHRGYIEINPVGSYNGYTAKSLLKFTDFHLVENIPLSLLDTVEMVLPVSRAAFDSNSQTTITLHRFSEAWTEADDTLDIDNFEVSPMSSDTFPTVYTDSTNSYAPLTFPLDTAYIATWMDSSRADENNGVLLRGSSDSVMVFGVTTHSSVRPYLRLSRADTTIEYRIYPTIDYGVIDYPGVNADQDQVIMQQASGQRFTLRWPGLIDSLRGENSYVHSAELKIPVDRQATFSNNRTHQILVGEQSLAIIDSLEPANYSRVQSYFVSPGDSVLVIQGNRNSRMLRNYLQKLVSQDTLKTGLVFMYYNEGEGIQHLVLTPTNARLRVVFSEVQS